MIMLSSSSSSAAVNKPPSISTLGGADSPQLSLQSIVLDDVFTSPTEDPDTCPLELLPSSSINLQVFVPELQIQKCLMVHNDQLIWDIKQKLFDSLSRPFPQSFNFGLFLPPCEGRAGKFLLEDRSISDYPFHDCVPYVELKYKKRVYKMLKIDESALKSVHSKSNLKKFIENVKNRNAEKVEKMCRQGLDPNFHDSQGETPLTIAAGIHNNSQCLIQLIAGGAHLDFRNAEGQTAMHKAAFLSVAENVRTLLELGSSPNYKDLIGLTPLYYTMLTTDSLPEIAEMLLADVADLNVLDMHANTPLHQHVEQLLYYGAEINAQNVNGNTPLHVCAVNGRGDCAQVLLYRGAVATVFNKQGQTPVQVAQVVGNLVVADIILGHNANNIVPFRGAPKFNTRRRHTPTNTSQIRRRSLSHMSVCSAGSNSIHQAYTIGPVPLPQPSESLSIITDRTSNTSNSYGPPSTSNHHQQQHVLVGEVAGDYGTLRRIHPEAVKAAPGYEPNVPRILVIPRGLKGFGFILRGAKNVETDLNVPALQFFEGVDMSGMAMRAGLRPGDYLLEINGVDVRRARHEKVVELIHQAGDVVTLKVITVDPTTNHQQSNHYAPPSTEGYASNANAGTLRRNHSIPRSAGGPPPLLNGRIAPLPPQRHPSTGLSFGRVGGTISHGASSSLGDYGIVPFTSAAPITTNCRVDVHDGTSASTNTHHSVPPTPLQQAPASDDGGLGLLSINTNFDQQHQNNNIASAEPPPIRCASVKSRPSVARRISAAELEHLMLRQSAPSQSSQFQPIAPADPAGRASNEPKKFTSVSEMKRRAHQRNGNPVNGDDQQTPENHYATSNTDPQPQEDQRSRPPVLRPKTPPPPPPMNKPKSGAATYTKSNNAPPAPPPPPPNFLRQQQQLTKPSSDATTVQFRVSEEAPAPAEANGITSESLQTVKLRPAPLQQRKENNPINPSELFNSDLKDALARRRTKLQSMEHDSSESSVANSSNNSTPTAVNPPPPPPTTKTATTVVGRYNGLSLRESVRENVQATAAKENLAKPAGYSPPGVCFNVKKDSGYTSSRTSLEPSECGDEVNGGHHSHLSSNSSSTSSSTIQQTAAMGVNRVTLISQQIEDASAAPATIPCSSSPPTSRPLIFEDPKRTPAIDYDDLPDASSTADSSQDARTISSEFRDKKLADWTTNDVLGWLHHLKLTEYMESFATINGTHLVDFNRTKFTQLGVTRIAHRQIMEQSLKTALNLT